MIGSTISSLIMIGTIIVLSIINAESQTGLNKSQLGGPTGLITDRIISFHCILSY